MATWQRLHSTQLPCVQDGGWVPAAKWESKWKTMTYWKLCEACLVSEDYRWAGDTNTGNRCSIDWKLFWQKAIAGDLVQRQIDAKCILKPQIRLILRRATYSLWHCCRTSHRPHIGASCWKQWGAPLRSAGWYQDLLGALNGSSISVTPSLIALEGQSVTSFSSSCCRWNSCTNGDALLKWWVNWKILKKFFQGLQAGTSAK